MSAEARRVLQSVKAIKASPVVPGSGYGAAGVSYGSGMSPLVAEYAMPGMPYGHRTYGTALPRDPMEFLSGMFSPLSPIQPVAIDQPRDGFDRPQPRGFEYPVSWNMPIGVPGSEGLKLASFANLRSIADIYSVARACIKLRIQEILGLEWDIIPTKDAEKNMRGDDKKHSDFQKRREQAMEFWRNPDPNYGSFESWLSAILEDVLVIDALSLYLHPTRLPGKGLLGSNIASIEVIAGETIRPLLDVSGGRPKPPNPAYQQYMYGVPRTDLMTVINEEDLDGLSDAMVAEYRGDQLLYLPYFRRSWTPYGFSNLEQALIPAMMGIQRQNWQLDTYSEGTVPAVFISAGDTNSTPNQLRELQDALNAMAGDPAWKHKIIVLPGGSKIDPMKPQALADAFDEIMMTQMCCVPGTEIVTKRGLVAIEDIQLGDEVLTHKGRWRPVLSKFKNERGDRGVHRVTANGFDPLEVTGNHKMWTAQYDQTSTHRSVFRETGWIPAEELAPKGATGSFDALTIPVPKMGADGAVLKLADCDVRKGLKAMPAEIPMNAALGRLLGFYLAEGSQGRGDVRWSFNHNEFEYQNQLQMDLKTVFGLDSSLHEGTATTVVAYSVALADLFECGTARNKVVPSWAWEGSPEFYRALWESWIAGDGCVQSNGWRGYTSSKALAWQMRLVALALGYEPQIRTQKQPKLSVIDGRVLNGMDHIWVVQVVENKRCSGVYRMDGECLTSPVRENGESAYTGQVVWNLNVQEDHSYLTTGGCAINCMAFDVMPMELGISPRVSTTQSPAAGNQMAKASEQVNQRKALRPMLKWLKASVFDFVLQKVCKQDDMQWMWEGLEEGTDEQSQVGLLIQEISFGLRSIDEARITRGETPWGLPMTSDPVYATPNGLMPIGSIDPATGMPAALQPEVAPGSALPGNTLPNGALAGTTPSGNPSSARTVKPGKPNRLPTASVPGPKAKPTAKPANTAPSQKPTAGPRVSPSHTARGSASKAIDSKAALKELDLIRRQLKKDRSIEDWQPRDVPQQVMDQLRADLWQMDAAEAIMKARDGVYKALKTRAAAGTADREAAIGHVQSRVATDLRDLAQQLETGKLSTPDFLAQATDTLRAGIRAGLQAGAFAAVDQLRSGKALSRRIQGSTWLNIVKDDEDDDNYDAALVLGTTYSDYLDQVAAEEAQRQSGYLSGLLQDILAGLGVADWLKNLGSRLDLYAAQVRSAYEQGYGSTYAAMNAPGSVIYTWYTTSAKPCALCSAKEGQQFTEDQLPGFPGQGGFGGGDIAGSELAICMGGVNCKCYLSATTVSDGTGDGGGLFSAARNAWGATMGRLLGKGAQEITSHDHGDHSHPDETHEVYAYLARHYPSSVLDWVRDARWRGPVEVKLKDIVFERRPGGPRNEAKVGAIAHGVDDGHKLDPVVLVQTPDSPPYKVADGFHRLAALHKLGIKKVSAWVGEVDTDSGDWGKRMNQAKLNG
jgi:Hint domain/ParB-like nuclease domain